MFAPDFTTFQKLAKQGDLIPVYSEFMADLETPVSLFLKTAANNPESFLLESAEVTEGTGRYSFIGSNPYTSIEINDKTIITKIKNRPTKQDSVSSKDLIIPRLREFMHQHKFVRHSNLPSFVGGLVGYFGYEFVESCEDLKLQQKGGLQLPDAVLFLAQSVIVYDHLKRSIKIIYLANITDTSLRSAYQHACTRIAQIKRAIHSSRTKEIPMGIHVPSASRAKVISNTPKPKFINSIKAVKKYIKAGDCIQVVLSQRFELGKIDNDFNVYRILRSINPSPYMFYFRNHHLRMIGSSPETLVKKTGRIAETRPIAGTRKRGATEQEDKKFENQLKASKKEMAEHLMLVDLGRNDLGRVCDVSSIQVTEFAKVERYSHVMHLVSRVKGKLLSSKDSFDLLKACFPAGTVSGAPKIRAMQIIDELERESRGPYAGAVGYFSFNGDMDFCITIRTIVVNRSKAYVQAGAGIVDDSKAENEYQETINKAQALLRALEIAKESDAR